MAIRQPHEVEAPDPQVIPQESQEEPRESGVSAFTGEEEYVAWITPAMIKALAAAGWSKWNPSISPKLTGDLVEPTRPVEAKPPVDEKPVEDAIDDAGVLRSVDDVAYGEGEPLSMEPEIPILRPKGSRVDDTLRRVDTEYSPLRNDDAEPLTRISDLPDEEIRIRAEEGATLIKNSDLSMFDDTMSHQINFKLFNSSDQATAAQARMAELFRDEINTARRGTMTVDDIQRMAMAQISLLAKDVGVTPAFMEKFLRRQAGGDIPPVEEILAARAILEKSAATLKEMAWKIKRHEATDQDKLLFLSLWDFHRQLNAGYMGVRAEWGRAGAAFRGASSEGVKNLSVKRMEELINTYSGVMDLDTVVNQITELETTGQINKIVKAQESGMSKWGAAGVETYVSSLLSGIGTQINNGGGNLTMLIKAPIDLQLAALFGIGADPADKVFAGEAAAGLFTMATSFRKVYAAMMTSFKSGEPYGDVSKMEMGRNRAISAEALDLKGPMGWMADVLGVGIRFPIERVMGPIDAGFKVLNEQWTYGHMGYRQMMADVAKEGLTRQEAEARLNYYLENPTDEIIQEAIEFGKYGTLQSALGPVGRNIQKTINSWSIFKIIAPFVRTPGNILKIGFIESTPLGILPVIGKRYRQEMFPQPISVGPGGRTQYAPGALAKAHRARARMAFGSMLGLYIGTMAMEGRITGSGPKDSNERKMLMATGWRPRSILVRDENGKIVEAIRYEGYEPVSIVIGMVADLIDVGMVSKHTDLDETTEQKYADVSAAIIFAIAENTLNKNWMYGMHEALRAMEDPHRYGHHHLTRTVNSFLPFSGARRDARRATDNHMAEVRTMVENLKNSTPYLSQDLPLRLNIWGEPMKYVSFYSNRFQREEIAQDGVDFEMQRLLQSTREVAVKMPQKTQYGIELTAQQYFDFVNISRNVKNPDTGRDFKEEIAWMMEQPRWQETDETSELYMTDYMKVSVIRALQLGYDAVARAMFMENEPGFAERVKKLHINQGRRMVGDEAAIESGFYQPDFRN